jgi:hypothetical protein
MPSPTAMTVEMIGAIRPAPTGTHACAFPICSGTYRRIILT